MPKQSSEQAQDRIREDYRRTFKSSHGRRVLEDLMLYTGFFAPCATAKDEGRREVGIQILARLNKNNIEGLHKMEQEGMELTDIGEEFFNA